jgi:uncharacterized membrane protein YgdD (TMEM256/DUF423 family)
MTLWRLLTFLAALFLAAGVTLAAQGAHAGSSTLATASQFLMLQGAALLGALAAVATGHAAPRLGRYALLAVAAGAILFAGDLAVRGFGLLPRLFPLAAPIGGVAMIAGWALFALAALFRRG